MEVGASLRAAVDAGVVVLDGPAAWFRHPLLADVLLESYLPGEAAPVHAAWAGHLASTSTDGVDELRRLGDLATHQELAGADAAAFGSLLEAADVAEGLGVRREAADLLARAAALWSTGAPHPHDDGAHARLLQRASRACERVDRAADAWRLIGRACDLVDPARDPLWSSSLKIAQDDLAWHLGLVDDSPSRASSGAVLELTRADVDSREHADALAWTAENHFWAGQLDEATSVIARRHGRRRALEVGRRLEPCVCHQVDAGPGLAISGRPSATPPRRGSTQSRPTRTTWWIWRLDPQVVGQGAPPATSTTSWRTRSNGGVGSARG